MESIVYELTDKDLARILEAKGIPVTPKNIEIAADLFKDSYENFNQWFSEHFMHWIDYLVSEGRLKRDLLEHDD